MIGDLDPLRRDLIGHPSTLVLTTRLMLF